MLRFRWALAVAALASLALAACGGDGNGDSNSNANAQPAQGGEPLSDEAYLRVFCRGLTEYQDALLTAPTVDEIGDVVESYIANLSGVTPPEDLQDYQVRYIDYLKSALEDPTSLTVSPPPMPDEDVRDRLAMKVRDIDECKYPTFLEVRSEE